MTKKAIIIGATSGIGKELARVLAADDYVVGIAGRRTHLLDELKEELHNKAFAKRIDLRDPENAMNQLNELIAEMGGVDLAVISSGVGFINHDLHWPPEKETIEVNVSGCTAMANVFMHHFLSKGIGHLTGISSVAAIRGDGSSPAYNASKAFISNYMQGLRKKVSKSGMPIVITDIKPGFVDTSMARGEGLFWVAPPQKAARQIYNAIKKKKRHAYITRRWRLIGWLLKIMPEFIYNKM